MFGVDLGWILGCFRGYLGGIWRIIEDYWVICLILGVFFDTFWTLF